MSVRNEESEYVRILSRRLVKAANGKKVAKALTGRAQPEVQDVDISQFTNGKAVSHKTFGEGIIQSVKENIATIDFQKVGQKQLSLPFAIKMGFLTAQ